MVRFEPEVKQTFRRMAGGTALCTAIMWVVFAVLGLFGLGGLTGRVLLSSVLGAAVAVGNFYILCVTGTKIVDAKDEDQRKKLLKLSYNARLLFQAVWILLCIAVSGLHLVAGVAPLLFPRVTIYYLQITGKFDQSALQDKEPVEEIDATEDEAPAETPGDEGGET